MSARRWDGKGEALRLERAWLEGRGLRVATIRPEGRGRPKRVARKWWVRAWQAGLSMGAVGWVFGVEAREVEAAVRAAGRKP